MGIKGQMTEGQGKEGDNVASRAGINMSTTSRAGRSGACPSASQYCFFEEQPEKGRGRRLPFLQPSLQVLSLWETLPLRLFLGLDRIDTDAEWQRKKFREATISRIYKYLPSEKIWRP